MARIVSFVLKSCRFNRWIAGKKASKIVTILLCAVREEAGGGGGGGGGGDQAS